MQRDLAKTAIDVEGDELGNHGSRSIPNGHPRISRVDLSSNRARNEPRQEDLVSSLALDPT